MGPAHINEGALGGLLHAGASRGLLRAYCRPHKRHCRATCLCHSWRRRGLEEPAYARQRRNLASPRWGTLRQLRHMRQMRLLSQMRHLRQMRHA